MEATEVGGLRVAYERAGSGPPLVFLHGYLGDGPTTWRHQIDELQRAYTVVAWDAPGTGQSSDPPESFGVAGYADCLAGLLGNLGIEQAHIVGLSFGGALAICFANRHPSVPTTLTLTSAYAGWRGSLPADAAEARLRQALELSELPPDDLVDALLPTMFSPGTAPAAVAAFGDSMRAFHPTGFRAMARASAEDLRHALPEIRVPTLLIYGDNDVRAPMHVANEMQAAIAGSTLAVLSGAGHVCNIEAPEEFNATVRNFLGRVRP
jgi:pimeloyl-ACP methyl ester carboxylesterase